MSFDPSQPRGHATHAGRWSEKNHTDAEVELPELPGVFPGQQVHSTVTVDGDDVLIVSDDFTGAHPEDDVFWQAICDPYVAGFITKAGASEALISQQAKRAFNEVRVTDMVAKLGQIPELDGQLKAEIARLNRSLPGMVTPQDWDERTELTRASDFIGDHYDVDIPARADYMEVGDDGVSFGYRLGDSLLEEILVGERRESGNEYDDEMEHSRRKDEAMTAEVIATVEKHFRETFDADVYWGSDDGFDFALEFYLPYGDAGAAGMSLERMGERGESETKLLDVQNQYESGSGKLRRELAKALGYHYGMDSWVKNEPVGAAAV